MAKTGPNAVFNSLVNDCENLTQDAHGVGRKPESSLPSRELCQAEPGLTLGADRWPKAGLGPAHGPRVDFLEIIAADSELSSPGHASREESNDE